MSYLLWPFALVGFSFCLYHGVRLGRGALGRFREWGSQIRTARYERLYASQKLIDFARSERFMSALSQAELTTKLADAGIGELWYGEEIRYIRNDGTSTRRTDTIDLKDRCCRLQAVQEVLTVLKGESFRQPAFDYRRVRIVVVPDDMKEPYTGGGLEEWAENEAVEHARRTARPMTPASADT